MRRLLIILSLLIMVGNYLECSGEEKSGKQSAEKEKEAPLKLGVVFSHVVSRNTPKGQGAVLLKKYIEAKDEANNNEKFFKFYNTLQIYPDSLLFNDTKVMDALKENKVQLAAPSISKLIDQNKKLQIFDFPFLFKNIEEVEKFYDDQKQNIFFPEEKNNLMYLDEGRKYVILSLWHGGMKQLSSNKKINGDKLLKGSKIRVQSSPVLTLTFEGLGADPFEENDLKKVYKKLKNEDIDGQENTWSNIEAEKYYEQQRYFMETNHSYLGYLLITNEAFWEMLKKQRKDGKGYHEIWTDQIEKITKEVNVMAGEFNETSKQKIKQELGKKPEQAPKGDWPPKLSKEETEKWCKSVYNSDAMGWKNIVEEIGKKLIEEAIKGKEETCPFSDLKKILDESTDIPDLGHVE